MFSDEHRLRLKTFRIHFGGNDMKVKWTKDADIALDEGKKRNKPILIDFSAAPA